MFDTISQSPAIMKLSMKHGGIAGGNMAEG